MYYFILTATDIKRCPAGDTDCIKNVANSVMKLNAKSKLYILLKLIKQS